MKRINKLRSGIEIKYQSKDEALKGLLPSNVINILDKNPLSDSFKIRLFGKIGKGDFEKLASSLSLLEGIEKIRYHKESTDFLSRVQNILLRSFLMLCGVYLLGIMIILSYLSLTEVKLYKEEREVLYLSGMTKWSISLSLLISSIIDGLIGSLVALVLLFAGYASFVQGTTLFGFEIVFFSLDIILSLLGVGILLGFLTKIPTLFFI